MQKHSHLFALLMINLHINSKSLKPNCCLAIERYSLLLTNRMSSGVLGISLKLFFLITLDPIRAKILITLVQPQFLPWTQPPPLSLSIKLREKEDISHNPKHNNLEKFCSNESLKAHNFSELYRFTNASGRYKIPLGWMPTESPFPDFLDTGESAHNVTAGETESRERTLVIKRLKGSWQDRQGSRGQLRDWGCERTNHQPTHAHCFSSGLQPWFFLDCADCERHVHFLH